MYRILHATKLVDTHPNGMQMDGGRETADMNLMNIIATVVFRIFSFTELYMLYPLLLYMSPQDET